MNTQKTLLAALLLLFGVVLMDAVCAEALPSAASATTSTEAAAPPVNATTTAPGETVAAPAETAPAAVATTPAAVSEQATAPSRPAYTEKGADTCLKCHDEDSAFPVFSIFKTRHAQGADKRTPFANLQCETCHGPGGDHIKKVKTGEKQALIMEFGTDSPFPAAEQNKVCLSCHQGNNHVGWQGSMHDNAGVACASCHSIHNAHDPVLTKATQPDVCYTCHKKQRADFFKPSKHPVNAGVMTCTDCHKPHGSAADKLLAKSTVNQTCYTCHAEKRGPFLWEHAPVAEDCTNCHNPHGSVHASLLKKDPPLLCQQCHGANNHPQVAQTGNSLPGGTDPSNSQFLLAGGCTNCHSQVHGSNHPSGARLMR